ncbi:MAG TPA: ankyrin repeat domain-containing protein [Methylomicrobium sp.]|nr:ankyrin repeat domain-containing protein [Methylomicrobium sp.]
MSYKGYFFSCLLLVSTLLAFSSCKDKTEYPPNNVTVAKIKEQLVNRDISDIASAEFQINKAMYVRLLDNQSEGGRATSCVLLKAIDTRSKTGLQGDLELIYQYSGGSWVLSEIKAKSIEKMEEAYANRLADLVDSPLHFAANIGDIEQVELEITRGTPVDSTEPKKLSSALMFAAERGSLDIVKRLKEAGADINHTNKFGFAALHAATNANQLEVAKYLLNNGATVDPRDHLGQTPLYFAAEKNYLEISRELIAKGADVNAKTQKSWTPLYAAAANNALDVAKALIEHGALVNIKTREGTHSPLLIAAYNNNIEMVRLLLVSGADSSAKLGGTHSGFRNLTAMELAKKQGNAAIVELLQKKTPK